VYICTMRDTGRRTIKTVTQEVRARPEKQTVKNGIMKSNVFRDSEKGIAVVLALGVVSLLLIIAVGFITTAIIERKTEENYSSLTVARLVAQSGLKRVIAGMKLYSSDVSKDFTDIFSKNLEVPSVSNNVKRENLGNTENEDGLLQIEVNDITYYNAPGENYNVDIYPTWQYLPFDHNTNTPIIGFRPCHRPRTIRCRRGKATIKGSLEKYPCLFSNFHKPTVGIPSAGSRRSQEGRTGCRGSREAEYVRLSYGREELLRQHRPRRAARAAQVADQRSATA